MDDLVFILSFGFLLLVLLAIVSCTKVHLPPPRPPAAAETAAHQIHIKIEQGLDEDTVHSFPNLLYSEAKASGKSGRCSVCCPICLLDYEETDRLRLLPDCDHLFHLQCVDPWLRLHATYPICRSSPAPVITPPTVSSEITATATAAAAESSVTSRSVPMEAAALVVG